jgi:hypothetical protein
MTPRLYWRNLMGRRRDFVRVGRDVRPRQHYSVVVNLSAFSKEYRRIALRLAG